MRYSGSRFVRETSAMVIEKDEAYHGPGKALRGWKNWACTMRKVRAASMTMGTRAPSCERDSSESSMARWAFSHRQKRRAFEKVRQIWSQGVLGEIDTMYQHLSKHGVCPTTYPRVTCGPHSSNTASTKLISCNIRSAG